MECRSYPGLDVSLGHNECWTQGIANSSLRQGMISSLTLFSISPLDAYVTCNFYRVTKEEAPRARPTFPMPANGTDAHLELAKRDKTSGRKLLGATRKPIYVTSELVARRDWLTRMRIEMSGQRRFQSV